MAVSVKVIVLILLVAQNSSHILLTGYTKKVLHQEYISSVVILCSEVLKTTFSWVMMGNESKSPAGMSSLLGSSYVMGIPAFIYFVNNWLSFIALDSLSPAVYSTLAQLKLLTTAIFAVLILRTKLSPGQWRALGLLTTGSVLVQLNPCKLQEEGGELGGQRLFSGTLCMLIYATLSGFAGIYFERVLKGTPLTVWQRNFQLGVYSIAFALLSLMISDLDNILENGLFKGFTAITFVVVFTSAAGGILVAFVVKHADNIVKGFATAFAIVLTSVISYVFLENDLGLTFAVGAANVILSIFIYSDSTPSDSSGNTSPKILETMNIQITDTSAVSPVRKEV